MEQRIAELTEELKSYEGVSPSMAWGLTGEYVSPKTNCNGTLAEQEV